MAENLYWHLLQEVNQALKECKTNGSDLNETASIYHQRVNDNDLTEIERDKIHAKIDALLIRLSTKDRFKPK